MTIFSPSPLKCSALKFLALFFQDYLKSLGKSRTAEVKKDARVGEAEAARDSGIKVRD